MSKIRILPEQLANRIAAGEVVERPASVVKELLENSLDAGATRIEIEIEGSGTRLIRIIDNGEGMDEDDMLLCLERHGTSKIASDQDLAAISSLGFRGEAIPSIASVSRMTISSRMPEASLGARVVVDYGRVVKVHEIGCSCGTIFEISNLFGNTPARRKFLRTSRTELAHIVEVVKSYALAAPSTTFILRVDGRELLHFEENQSLPDRLRAIIHYEGQFLEVGRPGDKGCQAHGYLLPPEAVVAGSAGIRLLVNGRAVRDRMIIHAVAEGFRNFLMKGRSPAGLIHLRLPPEDVDVNVHPTKQEIRLRNSKAIHQMISQSVEQAIGDHQKKIQGTLFRSDSFHSSRHPMQDREDVEAGSKQYTTYNEELPSTDDKGASWKAKWNQDNRPPQEPAPPTAPAKSSHRGALPLPFATTKSPLVEQTHSTSRPYAQKEGPRPQAVMTMEAPALLQSAEPTPPEALPSTRPLPKNQHALPESGAAVHGLQVIGQYDNLYIFCQSANGGLLVVDQHAAHERLLFEDLKRQFMQGQIASQTLLFPVTVELSLAETECVEHHGLEIRQMGFTVREFGGNSFIISSVPAMAGQCNPRELFLDILGRFAGGEEKKGKGSILDDILASMACKAAVKAGDQLHTREIDALLTRMARADLFSHCPHGRPVLKHFTSTEVKKWFHRT